MKKIYYGKAIYNNKEIKTVNKVLRNNRLNLIDGPHVKKLEKVLIKKFGKKYGLMVNSGSSANLLALNSFNFKKGSEIITTSLTFSTTVAPIYQLGLIPHFVGVLENKFIADTSQIEDCINKIFGFETFDWLTIYSSIRGLFGFRPKPPPPIAIICPFLSVI